MRSVIPWGLVPQSGYPSSVGASHPLSVPLIPIGTTFLHRTESGRPNLTLPLVQKIQRREGQNEMMGMSYSNSSREKTVKPNILGGLVKTRNRVKNLMGKPRT